MPKHFLMAVLCGLGLSPFVASAGTFETIKDPVCNTSQFNSWSTGEQYVDGNNGVLPDQWSMLARWQGPNFVSNAVSYDIGAFTGLHSAAAQRGVQPESSGGTPGVQVGCYDVGMWINTWGNPHRPIVGGGYNDMWGYSFSSANQVQPFIKNGVPTSLVLQTNAAVPYFASSHYLANPNTGLPFGAVGQVGLFAYLRDRTQPAGGHPIVVAAMTHMSNADAGYMDHGLQNRDYSAADTQKIPSRFPNWTPYDPNGKGVWFVSAPISSQYFGHRISNSFLRYPIITLDAATATWDNPMAEHTDVANYQSLPFYRAYITPTNMANIATVLNTISCPSLNTSQPDCDQLFSTDPNDWYLEYAGVIAEATLGSEDTNWNSYLFDTSQPTHYDVSSSNWVGQAGYNDTTKDQITLGVHLYAPGIYRYYN